MKVFFLFVVLGLVVTGTYGSISDTTVFRGIESHHNCVIMLQKAENLLNTNPDEAFDFAIKAFNYGQLGNDSACLAIANSIIGRLHLLRNEPDEALICFTKSGNYFSAHADSLSLKSNYFWLAKAYYAQNKWEQALGELLNAQKIADKNANETEFVDLHDLMARTYFNLNQNDSGKKHFERIIPRLQENKQYNNLGNLYNNIGVYYYRKLDFENALENYYKALENNIAAKNQYGISVCYNNIGIIHRKLGNYQEALESFEKAYKIKSELNEIRGMAITLNSMGIVYQNQKNYEKAILHFNQSLSHCNPNTDGDLIAGIYNNLGSIWIEKKQPDSALHSFNRALMYYAKDPKSLNLATTYKNLASSFLLEHVYDSALYYTHKAFNYSNESDLIEQKLEVLYVYYQIYKATQQNAEALNYFEQYVVLKDSIDKTTYNKQLEAQSLKLFSQQKIKENLQLNKENKEKEIAINTGKQLIVKQQRYIAVFILALSFIGFALIAILYLLIGNLRKNKKLTAQNQEISSQKEKIEEQHSRLAQVNEQLEHLSIAVDKTDNAISIIDKDGNFIWFNQGFTKLYGFSPFEFLETIGSNLFSASTDPNVLEKIESCKNLKKPVVYTFEARCKNERKIFVQTTLTPLIDESGEIYQYIAVDADINEIKKAEIKIRQQHQEITKQTNHLEHINQELKKLSIIAERTNNAVTLINSKGEIDWVNQSFEHIYGFNLKEIKGKEYKSLINNYFGLDIKKLANVWFGTKEPIVFESLNKTKTGSHIWVNTSLTPLVNERGQVTKMVAIDSDITLLKETELKLSKINSDITASIAYAKQIQLAFLPKLAIMESHFREVLLIYKPKDIVSGDFYWFTHQQGKTVVVVADCTGHGVPGAFMSLIGINSLNKIVVEENIFEPAIILHQLRYHLITALGQKGEIGENADGMDISVAVINHTALLMEYAGAMAQGFLLRANKIDLLKGDKISLGFEQRNKNFNTKTYFLKPNDVVYLFTDGLVDQFGGADNQKLKTSRLKDQVIKFGDLPLKKQEEATERFLNEWQGPHSQLDDMLLLAFRI